MLGLRQDADQYLQQARNEHGFKKSYRFAERLNGRFFVSGISGGFEKYSKLKHANDLAPAPEKKPKYDYQPVLEKAQREELRREAEKLLELEEKLAEIQRIKEAKRRRDRQRQMRKLQFQSASCIQRFWRKTIRLRREGAANLLVKFLKAQRARQAVYTAAWAASVLKKFAIKASRRWRRWKFFQRQVKRIAAKNWYLVQEVACLWTQARRDVTDQFVHHVIQSGMKNAKRELMAKMGKVRRNSVAVKREPSTYFAFFLTEGSQADSTTHDDHNDGDDDSEYEDALATNNLSPNAFMRRQQARYLQYLKSYEGQSPPEKKKVYDYNDYRVKILVKKHQDVLKKMDDEEAARLERVERLRKKAQEDAELQKQAKERQRKEKERQKAALRQKQEEEHQEKLRQFQRQREKRMKLEEQRKKDEKRQEAERKLMRQEDPLVIAKRVRDWQLHVQQLKKAKEAKLLQEQQHKRPNDDRPLHHNPTPDELAQTEERRKAQEAEEARVREAIRQRIREKMQTLAQEKKQKEQEEKEKKEKLDQFMGAYQEQLQRQKEEFLKKQREKEKQRKAEEKRLKQAEKAKEQAMIDAILREQEAKDAEDRAKWQALPESDRRVIASAQDYDDQIPLEDFGFDDFIRKSLTKVYSRPPPSLTTATTAGGVDAAAIAAGAGAPPKWIPTSPEDEQKLQTIKAKVVKTVIKKIPASLRNTPYFKHYFKHTVVNRLMERGLASADDEALLHRQTEELLVQLHKQQAILNDSEDADSTVVAKATAALLTQPSAKWDVATAGDAPASTAAVGVLAMDTNALAPRGSFAQQPIAPTPTMPAPLSKSRSAGQLVVPGPAGVGAAPSVAVGLRGVKARKLQKEHAHSGIEPGIAAAPAAAAGTAAVVNDAAIAATAAAATDDDADGDPEDNEDLMALIARAKQRLLQPAPPVKTTTATHEARPPSAIAATSTSLHTSQSQPVLSSMGAPPPLHGGYETAAAAIALVPKAAATPKPLASSSAVAMPKMPSVQEFLRMQPGPPSLPGAPPSLDNIASRYPLSWDVPGATSMTGLPAGAAAGGAATSASSASALALPVKKKAKANAKASAAASSSAAAAGGKPPHGSAAVVAPTGPSLPTKKAQKPPIAAADMSDKELRARERQIRARRKHGPAIKLKPRSPSVTTHNGNPATVNSSSNQLSPSHDLVYDKSDADSADDNDEGEGDEDGDGDGGGEAAAAALAGSLDDYAFATTAEEYRERPDALITEKITAADDDDDGEGSDDGDDMARARSREATHSAGSQRSAGSSRVRSKLHAYEDYEEKLQADYLALRRQFQAKLKAATEEYHGRHSGGGGDVDGDGFVDGDGIDASQPAAAVSPSSRFHRRSEDGGDGEDDSVLTRSLTDLYVAMGDGRGRASASSAEGDTAVAEEDTAAAAAAAAAAEEEERRMREQLQVTTKDLLRSWALEDEMEARREAALRRGDGDAAGGDDDAEEGDGGYHGGQPMAMDDEAAAEYVAWLRSRGELPSDDEDNDDLEEESEEEFDPIQAHMAQRRREVAAARQEIRRSSAGATASATANATAAATAKATAAPAPTIKSRGGHRSAVATVNEDEGDENDDEDEDDDEEDEDDDNAVLFDEEKALLLAERRQRRRQQELAAMKQREAEKKKFWEALINT